MLQDRLSAVLDTMLKQSLPQRQALHSQVGMGAHNIDECVLISAPLREVLARISF
jgi:hypothetical protein